MSGGAFNYKEYVFDEIIDAIDEMIKNNNKPPFPEDSMYGWDKEENERFYAAGGTRYTKETINVLKEAKNNLKRGLIYAHRIDYLLSGDDDEDDFHRRLNEDLNNINN
jgi:hypothetical protein